MNRGSWLAGASIALMLTACGGRKESAEIQEGEAVSGNPIGLARQATQAGEEFERIQKELENMKPVEPLHFSELMKSLPAPPAGWESEPPRGQSNTMGEWSVTEVHREFSSGDKRIQVQILDWAYHRELYAAFFIAAAFSQETSEGYNKGIKIGDEPGREEYQTASKHGTLAMLVGKRFFVTITGDNVEAKELREWWDRIDAQGLRSKAS